jgi:site-specific recombinase XerD
MDIVQKNSLPLRCQTWKKVNKKVTPHVCRHTYCSNMAKTGMNPKALQYIMGHSDISITLDVYTHIKLEDARDEIEKIHNRCVL